MKNKKKGLVSTLICTYNAENFLKGTIESVLDQTYRNQEILIWDDGSTDNTINIITEYQKKDNRIKLWTSKDLGKKLGPYGGLNFLIDKSQGEFIAIQDHDDIWHPEKLEKQVEFLNKNKEFIACGTQDITYYMKEKLFFINSKYGKNIIPKHTTLLFKYNVKLRLYNLEQEEPDVYFIKQNFFGSIYTIQCLGLIWRRLPNSINLSIKRKKNKKLKIKDILSNLLHKSKYFLCLYTKIKNILGINVIKCYNKKKFIKKYFIFNKYL